MTQMTIAPAIDPGHVQLDVFVITMLTVMFLIGLSVWRTYRIVAVGASIQQLSATLSSCSDPGTCGSRRVTYFLNRLGPIFKVKTQLWYAAITLAVSFVLITLSVVLTSLFPSAVMFEHVGYAVRGGTIGFQISAGLVMWLAQGLVPAKDDSGALALEAH